MFVKEKYLLDGQSWKEDQFALWVWRLEILESLCPCWYVATTLNRWKLVRVHLIIDYSYERFVVTVKTPRWNHYLGVAQNVLSSPGELNPLYLFNIQLWPAINKIPNMVSLDVCLSMSGPFVTWIRYSRNFLLNYLGVFVQLWKLQFRLISVRLHEHTF